MPLDVINYFGYVALWNISGAEFLDRNFLIETKYYDEESWKYFIGTTRNSRIYSKNEMKGKEIPFHPVMLRQTNPSDLGIFEII